MLFSKVFIEEKYLIFCTLLFRHRLPVQSEYLFGLFALGSRLCTLCFTQMCQKVHKDVRVFLHAV